MLSPSLAIRAAPAVFAVLWSTGFIASKLAAPYAEPFTFLAIRFALVAALLIPACVLFKAPWPGTSVALHAAVAGILIQACYLGGVFWAIHRGMPAGVSALIVSVQPVVTALAVGPLLGERVPRLHWAGLVIGLTGVACVLVPKVDFVSGGIRPATIAACLASLAGITIGTIYQKRFVQGADLRIGSAMQFIGALLVTAVLSFALEERTVVWSGAMVIAMAWSVLAMSIGAVSLLLLLIRSNAVSSVAALFFLVPAMTSLIAWLLFEETLQPVQIAGMTLVVLAVFLTGWPGRRAS